jgi:hypothetical protein
MIAFRILNLIIAVAPQLVAGTLTLVTPPGSINTNAFGINDALYTAGSFQTDRTGTSNYGFVRNPEGTFDIFGLSGDPYPFLTPYDINNAGLVVGSVTLDRMTSNGERATQGFVRTTDGEIRIFEKPGAEATRFYGANDLGKIVTVAREAGETSSYYLFDYYSHEYTEISRPVEWQRMHISGINNVGTLVGYYELPGEFFGRGFLLDAKGNIELIDVPGSKQTAIESINDVGEIVGTVLSEDLKFRGFVRTASGDFHTFEFPDYLPGLGRVEVNYTLGFDINNNGVISGSGNVFQAGGNIAFLGKVPFEPFAVPEPDLTGMVAIAVGCFFFARGRWAPRRAP